MAIDVCGHRILVEKDPLEEETEGGIVLVLDEKLEKANQMVGTLVGVGQSAWKAFGLNFDGEPWAKVGDRIMFSRFAGKHIDDPETGKEYTIMNDEDVVAVVTGEKHG